MDDTSELILRQGDALHAGTLLVNPPDPGLLVKMQPGHFVSLHYGDFQALGQQLAWTGQFGLDTPLTTKVGDAIVWMPKARRELELLFAWVEAQMSLGGRVWLVGPKRGGVESGGKALKKNLGTGHKRDAARHCQLWEYHLGDTARRFEPDAWLTDRSTVSPLAVAPADRDLAIADMPGVFSEGRLDEGTRLLLGSLQGQPRGPLLDFACGAGVVAAAIKQQWPGIEVTLLDVQWQALVAARRTLELNDMDGIIVAADGLRSTDGRFGTIISNPPFHTGIKTDLSIVRAFIRQANKQLLPNGVLWIVANAFLPYRELLEEQFSSVVVVTENSRFRVYRAEAAQQPRNGSSSRRASR